VEEIIGKVMMVNDFSVAVIINLSLYEKSSDLTEATRSLNVFFLPELS